MRPATGKLFAAGGFIAALIAEAMDSTGVAGQKLPRGFYIALLTVLLLFVGGVCLLAWAVIDEITWLTVLAGVLIGIAILLLISLPLILHTVQERRSQLGSKTFEHEEVALKGCKDVPPSAPSAYASILKKKAAYKDGGFATVDLDDVTSKVAPLAGSEKPAGTKASDVTSLRDTARGTALISGPVGPDAGVVDASTKPTQQLPGVVVPFCDESAPAAPAQPPVKRVTEPIGLLGPAIPLSRPRSRDSNKVPSAPISPKSSRAFRVDEAAKKEAAELKSLLKSASLDSAEEEIACEVLKSDAAAQEYLDEQMVQPDHFVTAATMQKPFQEKAARRPVDASVRKEATAKLKRIIEETAVLAMTSKKWYEALEEAAQRGVDEQVPEFADAKEALIGAEKREARETAESELQAAIASRETIKLRQALATAAEGELPDDHPLVKEAQAVLADLDRILAAHTRLAESMRPPARWEDIEPAVMAAKAVGVDEALISAANAQIARLKAQDDARATLDKAIAERSVEALQKALDQAAAVGLPDAAPRVIAAKSTLEQVQAVLAATSRLENAIQVGDADQLREAIATARGVGLGLDKITAAEAKLEEVLLHAAARERLAAAIVSKEPFTLRSAIQNAGVAGIGADVPELTQAQALLAEIEAAMAAQVELDVAKDSRDLERLRAAISGARSAGVPAANLASAQRNLDQLEDQLKALAALKEAISSRKAAGLRDALALAIASNLCPEDPAIVEAKSILSELDHRLACRTELTNAVHHPDTDPVALESAIAEGRAAGVETDLLEEAEKRLGELKAQQAARVQLDAAIRARSADALRQAIEEGQKVGLVSDTERMVKAKLVLEEVEALLAATRQLEESTQGDDPQRIRDALKVANSVGVERTIVAAGETRLSAIEARLAARSKLNDAVAVRNVDQLRTAIDEAIAAGLEIASAALDIGFAELQHAKQFLDKLKTAVAALDELNAAIDAADAERLAAAIQAARGCGADFDQPDRITDAEKRLLILTELAESAAAGVSTDEEDPFALETARDRLVKAIFEAREVGYGDSLASLREAEGIRRRVHNTLQDLIGATRVFCRVRPTNSREKKLDSPVVVNVVGGMSVECTDEEGDYHKFEFDAAFGPQSTQEQIFAECKDLVQSVLDGYNITIFAYGQTGAGKTFTMMGVDDPPELKGVCPRTIDCLFEAIEANGNRFDIKVTAFMVEVYCSKINDLGDDDDDNRSKGNRNTRSHSSPRGRGNRDKDIKLRCIGGKVSLEGVQERDIERAQDLFDLLEHGNAAKKVTATAMNAGSSRSHTILGINVTCTNRETTKTHSGKILLVDLAGSERLKKSEVTGAARKEAIEINKSLTALGDVISAITLGKRVPYRNHTLTLLMSDSLGGTAKTSAVEML